MHDLLPKSYAPAYIFLCAKLACSEFHAGNIECDSGITGIRFFYDIILGRTPFFSEQTCLDLKKTERVCGIVTASPLAVTFLLTFFLAYPQLFHGYTREL